MSAGGKFPPPPARKRALVSGSDQCLLIRSRGILGGNHLIDAATHLI